ncbi:MAG: glycosyltransferase N-terminal domain-containing protein [Pyrinomonadaceae bacterium]
MYFLYSLLLATGVVLLSPRFAYLALRHRKYLGGLTERLGGGAALEESRPVIWLHCVSVGEVMAAVPLVSALRARYPITRCLFPPLLRPASESPARRCRDSPPKSFTVPWTSGSRSSVRSTGCAPRLFC